jgi:ATP-dependent DNA helicase RecG
MSSVIRYAYSYDEEVKTENTNPITPQSHPNHTSITPQSHLDHTSKLIFTIQDNPSVTLGELAEILGITIDAVKWVIRNLQKNNIIRRIGSNRSGYWEIIK